MSTDTTTTTGLPDRVVALLRTVVPSAWGALIVWLLSLVDWPPAVEQTITTQAGLATALVTALAIGAWYALWRWLEEHLPAWVVRIVLGSASTPTYATTTSDGAAVITGLPGEDDIGVQGQAVAVPGVTQPYGTSAITEPPSTGD